MPGRPEDGDQLAAPPLTVRIEGAAEQGQLALPADQRRARVALRAAPGAGDVDKPEGRHGLALALEVQRRHRLDLHRVADQLERLLADEDLAVGAACSSRAATFTASPVTKPSPREGSPAMTSPVFTPVRAWSRTPQRSSSCSLSSSSAVRISAAARTARSASSSRTEGMPNTAMTASPMNFSIAPPWRIQRLPHGVEVAG